jgi:hypothetical protein
MEGIQCRPVDNSRLVPDEHLLGILKRIDYDRSSVAQANLEDRLSILAPPTFAHCGMVRAQLLEMAEDR